MPGRDAPEHRCNRLERQCGFQPHRPLSGGAALNPMRGLERDFVSYSVACIVARMKYHFSIYMTGLPKAEWWKAAILSGIVSGFVGPGIGFVVEMRFVLPYLYLPWLWFWAIVAVGPPAFVLGSVGGLLLKALSARCATIQALASMAAALGLALGGTVVPFGVFVLGWGAKEKGLLSFGPTGAITGLVCTLLVLWLLRRPGLLPLRASDSKTPAAAS